MPLLSNFSVKHCQPLDLDLEPNIDSMRIGEVLDRTMINTTDATREPIEVGTTGTVSSLMSRELESVKDSLQASSSPRKKLQTAPVSVPCGYSPKRSLPRKNPALDPGSSSSSSNSGSRSPLDTRKPEPQRNGHRSPATTSGNAEKKKGQTYVVEVVDIKCNNPMSGRLKKLGFSKLSESIS